MGLYGDACALVSGAVLAGALSLSCGAQNDDIGGQSSSGGAPATGGSTTAGGTRSADGGAGNGTGGSQGNGQSGGSPPEMTTGGAFGSGGRPPNPGSSGTGGVGGAEEPPETGGSAGANDGGAGGGNGTGGAAEPPSGLIVPLFKAALSVGPSGRLNLSAGPVDLDGDGWLDLAWVERDSPALRVALNDRAGEFPELLEPSSWPKWGPVAFGDINGDGHWDAAGRSSGSNVHVALGRGDGTFADSLDISSEATLVNAFSLGDLDGDKKADLVMADRRVGPMLAMLVEVVLEVGASQLKTTLTFDDISDIPLSVLIRDLDGDGDQDVLIVSFSTTYLLRNKGAGVLGDRASYPVGMPLVVADFDGDRRLDLAGYNSSGVAILFGRVGGFAEPTLLPEVCVNARSVTAGDVDGDGRPDLACNGTTTRLHLNLGQGTFAPAKELSGVGEVTAILDWDHDGDADIVANGGATVFFNDGGAFPELSLPVPPFTQASPGSGFDWASPAELNGDDVLDVVVVGRTSLSTLLADSDGTLVSEARVTDHVFMGPPGVGDVDGDGSADLVLPYGDPSGRIGLALNDGTGLFGAQHFFDTGPYPTAAELVDLNRDGRKDAVTLTAAGVSVLLNDGQSGFLPHVDYPIADVRAFVTGDVDGDGAPDVVSVGPDGTYVSRNQGDGTLAPAVSYLHKGWTSLPLQEAPSSALTLVDLNGDHRPEIALALEGDLMVHRNKGNGTFGELIPIIGRNPTIPNDLVAPSNLLAGDLNGDHIPDLVALYGSTTRTYFSDGKGTLWRGEVYALAPSPVAFATGDLNGDGRVDLVRSKP